MAEYPGWEGSIMKNMKLIAGIAGLLAAVFGFASGLFCFTILSVF